MESLPGHHVNFREWEFPSCVYEDCLISLLEWENFSSVSIEYACDALAKVECV